MSIADAEWLSRVVRWDGPVVGSLVPVQFPVVLRLRHPAYREGPQGDITPLMWREAAPGTQIGLLESFGNVVSDLDFANGPKTTGALWTAGPEQGTLPLDLAARLISTFADVGSRSCALAVWLGFSDLDWVPLCRSDRANARQYGVWRGTISDAGTSLSSVHFQSPNIWWDASGKWFVHSDVDRTDTFVACTHAVSEAVRDHVDGYECDAVAREDRLYPLDSKERKF